MMFMTCHSFSSIFNISLPMTSHYYNSATLSSLIQECMWLEQGEVARKQALSISLLRHYIPEDGQSTAIGQHSTLPRPGM